MREAKSYSRHDKVSFRAKQFEHVIARKVTKLVVDLLESVKVTDHSRQMGLLALAAGNLRVQVKEKRARVGESGQVVHSRRVGSRLILDGVFNGSARFSRW